MQKLLATYLITIKPWFEPHHFISHLLSSVVVYVQVAGRLMLLANSSPMTLWVGGKTSRINSQ